MCSSELQVRGQVVLLNEVLLVAHELSVHREPDVLEVLLLGEDALLDQERGEAHGVRCAAIQARAQVLDVVLDGLRDHALLELDGALDAVGGLLVGEAEVLVHLVHVFTRSERSGAVQPGGLTTSLLPPRASPSVVLALLTFLMLAAWTRAQPRSKGK